MSIISISRRTDIPAFHSTWLLRRLHAGFCHWVNPFNGQVSRVSLRAEECPALVFWTRNPKPLLPHLPALREDGHRFYFHMTVNGYPRFFEPDNPPLDAVIASFRRLAEIISPVFTIWRYDPILLSDLTPASYHLERFRFLCARLAGATTRCYFSFANFYGKTERHLRQVEIERGITVARPGISEQRELTTHLCEIAGVYGITLYACCSDGLLMDGVQQAHCVDPELVRALRPEMPFTAAPNPTRKGCGCYASIDIGAYDTCGHGCIYCYATANHTAARRRLREADPDDTILWRPPSLRGVDLATRE